MEGYGLKSATGRGMEGRVQKHQGTSFQLSSPSTVVRIMPPSLPAAACAGIHRVVSPGSLPQPGYMEFLLERSHLDVADHPHGQPEFPAPPGVMALSPK